MARPFQPFGEVRGVVDKRAEMFDRSGIILRLEGFVAAGKQQVHGGRARLAPDAVDLSLDLLPVVAAGFFEFGEELVEPPLPGSPAAAPPELPRPATTLRRAALDI